MESKTTKALFTLAMVTIVLLAIFTIRASDNTVAATVSASSNDTIDVTNFNTEAEPAEENPEIDSPSFETKVMYVLGDHVLERTTPSVDSLAMNYYCAGETVDVVDQSDGWFNLASGGFIREDLLGDYEQIVPHFLETYPDLIVTHISNPNHRQTVEYWYYGELIASGDVVTGDAYKYPTPIGLYYITSRQTDVDTYPGDDWFCTFNGQIGFHNAGWPNAQFGGDIYKGNGSHGCVRCSGELAKAIYDHCRVNSTYVLVLP